MTDSYEIHPLTADRWDDLVTLFGPKGAQEGCWCMWWRQTAADWKVMHGEKSKEAMRSRVEAGEEPGLLAYSEGEPAGWISLGPRESFPRFEASKILKPIDDRPVWSIICFYIAKAHRRQGLSVAMLRAAIAYAKEHGATIVEGYPTDPKDGKGVDAFVFTGLMSAFEQLGFKEVTRRSETRPIMRLELE